jgi:arylsulfatase
MREQTFARQKAEGVVPPNAVLTPRPPPLPAWDTLAPDQRRLYSRFMEAYAGSLAFADNQVGRVIDYLRSTGQLDNTLVIYIQGDNGASAEGRMNGDLFEQSAINNFNEDQSYNLKHIDDIGSIHSYPLNAGGFGWALNAPFKWYKRIASDFGGTRNGMVISWPAHIARSGLRQQFADVTDIMPTILDCVGVKPPETYEGIVQMPLDGISMAYTFDQPDAPSHRTMQVFEMMENMAIYKDGWVAASVPTSTAWDKEKAVEIPLDKRIWQLFNVDQDFSESRDLAGVYPEKLQSLKTLFFAEAARNNILPIHSPAEGAAGRPSLIEGVSHFVYYPGTTRIPEASAPPIIRRSFTITAEVEMSDDKAHGVLVTQGGLYGGYAFYLRDGQLVFHYNAVGEQQYQVASRERVSAGRHILKADFLSDGGPGGPGGAVTLYVDGREVARGRIEHTLSSWISHTEGFDIGEDTITPIDDDYTVAASKFSGALLKLIVDIKYRLHLA